MDEQLPKNQDNNTDYLKNKKIEDYKYLILKLKNIKDTINLFNKKFLAREI